MPCALALTAIGLLAWAIHWGLAARFLRRDGDPERDSTVRKLFLYTVLLVGGIIIMLASRQLLVDLLELAFGRATRSNVIAGDVISPFSLLAVSGILWLYYERVARIARLRMADDVPLAIERAALSTRYLPDPDRVGQSLYETLAELGCKPVRAVQRISAVNMAGRTPRASMSPRGARVSASSASPIPRKGR